MLGKEDLCSFEDVDISDITCKDKLLYVLEKLHVEDEEFMEILVNALKHADITWEQPWYQEKGWLTRKLEQREGEDQFNEGKFSKAECDRVNKNWLRFVKKYDVPSKPFCLARWRNKEGHKRTPEELARRFVVTFLAKGLKRNLNQVFLHFVSSYSAPNRGKYSELELKIIKMCIFHFPKGGIQIASRILSREPRGIYKRLASEGEGRELFGKKTQWTLSLATKLVNLLMKYGGCTLEELKYKSFPMSVWREIEKDMNKNYFSIQKFWYTYLHVQLFVKYDIKIRKLRKNILKVIRKYPYEVWTDIRWKEIQKHFPDGMTTYFLYEAISRIIYSYDKYATAPIEDLINHAFDKLKYDKNKRLKTVIMNNDGVLEFIKYGKPKQGYISN